MKITAPAPDLAPATIKKANHIFLPSLFLTFEGFKSSIFDKYGLEKLKKEHLHTTKQSYKIIINKNLLF